MDDSPNGDTLDALADLFLTGQQAGQQAGTAPAPAASRPSPAPGGAADDALSGPEPYRLRPKPAGPGRPMAPGPDDRGDPAPVPPPLRFPGAADADPARFGDRDRRGPVAAAPPRAAPAAHVEAVLLGNLPGMSEPWLTQYAQLLADRDGAVAVLHVEDAQDPEPGKDPGAGLEIELVLPRTRSSNAARDPGGPEGGGGPGESPQPASHRSPGDREAGAGAWGETAGPLAVLDRLVRDARQPVRRVLVHLPTRPEPAVLDRLGDLGVWTLLSGADDAATAAASSLLRRLSDARPALGGCRVGLMIAGAEPGRARAAADRIAAEAGAYLHTPVELVAAHRRMTPARVRPLGRFEDADRHWSQLRDYLHALPEPETRAEPNPQQEPVPESEPETQPQPHPRPAWGDGDGDPQAGPREQPPAQSTAEPPDLAALLTGDARADLAGAVALEARCPHQPQVQLLLDQAGALHLLRRHTGPGPQLRAALLDLIEARHWVAQHLQLLRLTRRQCAFDADAPPTLHLFTDRADLAATLAARLGDLLRPHLLQRVTVGQTSTWFSTPLSESPRASRQ